MIDAAREGAFAFPAINVTSSQTLNGALQGLADARSDGIVEITTGGARYVSGPAADSAVGAHAFAELAHVLAAHSPVLIALHTDHATHEHIDDFLRPLLRESRARRRRGERPLFNSQMFDGSDLPLVDNLRIACELLREARAADVVLEVEIGIVGGEEDDLDHGHVARERLYTTPEDALAVAAALGTGEHGRYLLAATFGNVHGRHGPGSVQLRPELLGELQAAVRERFPRARGFDFVFHGSSGSTPSELSAAIAHGVVKVNIDTDMQYAFTRAMAEHVLTHQRSLARGVAAGLDKSIYDPRTWGHSAEAGMAERVREACRVLGSSGRSLVR